ncbi:MAG: hypothetical protein JST92_18845 [Deltaproteobacteria bacterium]|nr:hypothetical protein [Deltaproteobacteria bacterium]
MRTVPLLALLLSAAAATSAGEPDKAPDWVKQGSGLFTQADDTRVLRGVGVVCKTPLEFAAVMRAFGEITNTLESKVGSDPSRATSSTDSVSMAIKTGASRDFGAPPVHVMTLVKDYQSSTVGGVDEQLVSAALKVELKSGSGGLLYKDLAESHAVGTKLDESQTISLTIDEGAGLYELLASMAKDGVHWTKTYRDSECVYALAEMTLK